jgi:hypothetical protein
VPAPQPAQAATPPAALATVVVQCPPTDCERALRTQLDEARSQLKEARGQLDQTRGQLDQARRKAAEAKEQVAKLEEAAGMPDHAVAALLLSDRPALAPLRSIGLRPAAPAGRGRVPCVQAEVYLSPHPHETMAAVVLTTRNPREAPTWEPKEAFITAPAYSGHPSVPVALRSSPERIRPGETAQIALVFDLADVEWYEDYITLALFRDGKWEMDTEFKTSDFQVASGRSGGDQ